MPRNEAPATVRAPEFALDIERVAGVRDIAALFGAVARCLESWPQDRVRRLQSADGGWAPFDARQRPKRITALGALHCHREAIDRHCAALCDARVSPPDELIELQAFLASACRAATRLAQASAARRNLPENRQAA